MPWDNLESLGVGFNPRAETPDRQQSIQQWTPLSLATSELTGICHVFVRLCFNDLHESYCYSHIINGALVNCSNCIPRVFVPVVWPRPWMVDERCDHMATQLCEEVGLCPDFSGGFNPIFRQQPKFIWVFQQEQYDDLFTTIFISILLASPMANHSDVFTIIWVEGVIELDFHAETTAPI
jgi:hypothetical protein